MYIGIDLPTDDLLKVIISKTLSDNQININPNLSDYIIKNVERSYEKMFKFFKEVDELSLSTGKSININLIKSIKQMNKYRTHNCSELSENDIGQNVYLSGWLHRKRIMEIYFCRFTRSLWYDTCVIENNNKFFPILEKSKPESVLKISGKVVK